jgi:O-antigen ligase
MEESARLRPILAAVAWEIWQDRPIFGCGFGQYKKVDGEYIAKREFDLPMEKALGYYQHNIFLSVLVETGIVGLSAYLLLACQVTREAFMLGRAARAPLWARQIGLITVMLMLTYFVNGIFHEMSIIPMVNMLVFFMAGLTRNLASASRETCRNVTRRAIPEVVSSVSSV